MILGAVLYLLIGEPVTPVRTKLVEMARIMFFCGLFVTLLQFMTRVLSL